MSNANNATCEALKAYGWHLGIAFQLIDDALDYTNDSAELGKNTGDDLAEGKVTLPIIHAISHGSTGQANQLRQAIETRDAKQLPAIIDIINDTSSLQYTIATAQEHVSQAKQSLATLAPSTYQRAMLALADFAVARNY